MGWTATFQGRQTPHPPQTSALRTIPALCSCLDSRLAVGFRCAERSALFTTYSLGYRKEDILGIAIASLSSEPASPCGACRQVINELMDQDAFVVYGNDLDVIYEMKVKDLLPGAFSKENL